jgi:hypothetical protein
MTTNGLSTWVLGSILVLATGVSCSDDTPASSGTAGMGASAGAGRSGAGSGGKGGSSNPGGGTGGMAAQPLGGIGGDGATGHGGEPLQVGGAGGEPSSGGQGGGADDFPGVGGGGGEGGDAASCDSVRAGLLGTIDAVSNGAVTVTSPPNAAKITVIVDASAGGFMAAARNPYLYVSLANKARVDVTDLQADISPTWDLALKRDNIRSNGGDSGPGEAEVAELPGASFDAVTAATASSAVFSRDTFIDANSCAPITDETGKPATSFNGWYVYAAATMSLTPADKVYLVRGANGTSLYKLQIENYYADVEDGQGGTVKKSGVFALTYEAL